jgi:hypothetical protein
VTDITASGLITKTREKREIIVKKTCTNARNGGARWQFTRWEIPMTEAMAGTIARRTIRVRFFAEPHG